MRAPGHLLLAIARRVLTASEIDRVIEPAIADLQHEWEAGRQLSRPMQLFVRTRAHLSVWRVVVPRLIVSGVRASVEPPDWSVLRTLVGPFLILTMVNALVGSFGPAAARTREHWLFYLPDRVLWFLPLLPIGLSGWSRNAHTTRLLLRLRASDIAKLSAMVCLTCFVSSGWIAPLLRQQYLLSLGLSDFVAASVHQWTLPQLVNGLQSTPDGTTAVVAGELQMRLLFVALALACAPPGWAGTRATLLWGHGIGISFSGVGLMTLWILLRIGAFATPSLSSSRIIVEWLCVAALPLLALAVLRAMHRVERQRRPALEARALDLLQALPQDRQAQLIGR